MTERMVDSQEQQQQQQHYDGDDTTNDKNDDYPRHQYQQQQQQQQNLRLFSLLQLLPSPQALQRHIATWERLLMCSHCHELQDTLDDLWQQDQNSSSSCSSRPICTSCLEESGDDDENDHGNDDNDDDNDKKKRQGRIKGESTSFFGDEKEEDIDTVTAALPLIPPPRRISEYLQFGGNNGDSSTLSRKEGAKEPALVLQRLKRLLWDMTRMMDVDNNHQTAAAALSIPKPPLWEQHKELPTTGEPDPMTVNNSNKYIVIGANNCSQKLSSSSSPTTPPEKEDDEEEGYAAAAAASQNSLDEQAAAVHPKYPSLQPDFLPNMDCCGQQRQQQQPGFRYRRYGGEVYDPTATITDDNNKRRRRRRYANDPSRKRWRHHEDDEKKEEEEEVPLKKKKDDMDDEFDFPDSQSKEEGGVMTTADADCDSCNEYALEDTLTPNSQRMGQKQGYVHDESLRSKEIRIDTMAARDSTATKRRSPGTGNGGKSHSGDEASPPKGQPNDSVNSSVMESSSPNLLLFSQSQTRFSQNESIKASQMAKDKKGDSSIQGGDNSQDTEFGSIDTEALPQTADFVLFQHRPVSKTDTSSASQIRNGAADNRYFQSSIQEELRPQGDGREYMSGIRFSRLPQSLANGHSQSQPQSIDTDALPQTCDFGKFGLESESLPQSIATEALPQTADFGLLVSSTTTDPQQEMLFTKTKDPSLPLQQSKTPRKEPDETRNPKEKGSNSLDDSQDTIVDSQLVSQTADFGKASFHNDAATKEATHKKLSKLKDALDQTNDQQFIATANMADSTYAAKTPKGSEASSRRVTPPSVSLTDRLDSSCNQVPAIVVHENLSRHDEKMLHSLSKTGLCRIDSTRSKPIAAFVSQQVKAFHLPGVLLFNSDNLEVVNRPSASGSDSSIMVCLQSFQYLIARACGWKLLSSDCLGAMQRGLTDLGEYEVWGDVQLYRTVSLVEAAKHYLWHKRATWWDSVNISPSQSSIDRHEDGRGPLLSNFEIVVAKMECDEEAKLIESDSSLVFSFGQDGVSLFHGGTCEYRSLKGDQIDALCRLAGATVVSSLHQHYDAKYKANIVLIPDTLEDEATFLQNQIEANVVESDPVMGQFHSRTKLVYYSWVVDSILADELAPVENYSIDIVHDATCQFVT